MLNSLHFATRFIDIVADMHLTAAFDTSDHSFLLSYHSTSFGFTHTWLQSYLIGRYQSVHAGRHSSTIYTYSVHLCRSPEVSPWASALFIYTSLPYNIVNNSFNIQHCDYADDTMQIYISLSSTGYSADISNLTHCLSTHDPVLVAQF